MCIYLKQFYIQSLVILLTVSFMRYRFCTCVDIYMGTYFFIQKCFIYPYFFFL